MTRSEIEDELTERLATCAPIRRHIGLGSDLSQVVAHLLPWVMEMREDAAMHARIECGELP